MTNPYEVLGVPESISDEELKSVYRTLVKKYHPDQYRDNPLFELAGEKLKGINEAYDEIQRLRLVAGGRKDWSGYAHAHTSKKQDDFARVREAINKGEMHNAEAMLSALPHVAEWFYLTGIIQSRKGWYTAAYGSFRKAVSMDASNREYRAALERMKAINNRYSRRRNTGRGDSADCCTICAEFWCTDSCCYDRDC